MTRESTCMRRVAFILVLAVTTACSATIPPQQLGERFSMVAALDNMFETVVFIDSSLLDKSLGFKAAGDQPIRGMLGLPIGPLSTAIQQLGSLSDALAQADGLEYVLVGAKNFQPPASLGPVVFDAGCVIKLRHPLQIETYMSNAAVEIAGQNQFWKVSFEWGEPNRTTQRRNRTNLYFTQPAFNYLIAASTVELTQQLASSVRANPSTPDVGMSEMEWKVVSSSHYWAFRNYKVHSESHPQASGREVRGYQVPSDAKSFLFQWRESESRASVRYASAQDSDPFPSHLAKTLQLSFTRTGHGVWEAQFDPSVDAAHLQSLFGILTLLGFGVWL